MIEISHLYKTFRLKSGAVEAVKDVSLNVKDGEIYGVIGYSGAGKSTLVRCLNLLEQPDSGKVSINGITLFESFTAENGKQKKKVLPARELNRARKGIGMIFQHFNLLDRSTVYENVAYPLKYTGKSAKEIKSKVISLLDLVGLTDKMDVYPSQLSGGQKQRVAIARALANDPKVLLSDEATSALDPEATESILNLLKDLNKKLGLTIVLITHEMSIIKTLSDKVAVMEDGRVVEEGDTYAVFSAPQASITKKFVNSTSSLYKMPSLIASDPGLKKACDDGKLFKLTFDKDCVGDAVISEVSRLFSVNMNIVLASIDVLRAGTLGHLVAVIDGTKENLEATLSYLRECKVGVEVIGND